MNDQQQQTELCAYTNTLGGVCALPRGHAGEHVFTLAPAYRAAPIPVAAPPYNSGYPAECIRSAYPGPVTIPPRVNHFFNDALGDPETCRNPNHLHPRDFESRRNPWRVAAAVLVTLPLVGFLAFVLASLGGMMAH